MSQVDSERLEAELKAIRDAIKELAQARMLPSALTVQEAAHQLSVGLTTMRAMIKAGRIEMTEPIGGYRKVPLSEVLRLAQPRPSGAKVKRSMARRTAATDSTDLKAWLKQQNKRGQ